MLYITCPHCQGVREIDQINCGIFRDGVRRDTFAQMPPHASADECARMRDQIWGCGKPFRVERVGNGTFRAVKCDYV